MRLRLCLSILMLHVLALSASAQGGRTASGRDFFPLRVGDSWRYRHNEGAEFTFKVLSEQKQADGTSLYLFEKLSGPRVHSWFSHADGWVLLYEDAYPEQAGMKIKYAPPKQFLKNPLVRGATWSWKGTSITGTDATESSKVIGPEVVQVPAGRFRAMKVVSQVMDGGATRIVTAWYAAGIGLVKSSTESGAINYGWELIDYSFRKADRKR